MGLFGSRNIIIIFFRHAAVSCLSFILAQLLTVRRPPSFHYAGGNAVRRSTIGLDDMHARSPLYSGQMSVFRERVPEVHLGEYRHDQANLNGVRHQAMWTLVQPSCGPRSRFRVGSKPEMLPQLTMTRFAEMYRSDKPTHQGIIWI